VTDPCFLLDIRSSRTILYLFHLSPPQNGLVSTPFRFLRVMGLVDSGVSYFFFIFFFLPWPRRTRFRLFPCQASLSHCGASRVLLVCSGSLSGARRPPLSFSRLGFPSQTFGAASLAAVRLCPVLFGFGSWFFSPPFFDFFAGFFSHSPNCGKGRQFPPVNFLHFRLWVSNLTFSIGFWSTGPLRIAFFPFLFLFFLSFFRARVRIGYTSCQLLSGLCLFSLRFPS